MRKIVIIIGMVFLVLLLALLVILRQQKKVNTTVPSPSSSFSITPTSTTPPDTGSQAPIEEWNQALEQYKIDDPDFYLANFAAYKSNTFAINYFFKSTPQEHYAFRVELFGTDRIQAKRDTIEWIALQGLTQEQIDQLDIEYVGE